MIDMDFDPQFGRSIRGLKKLKLIEMLHCYIARYTKPRTTNGWKLEAPKNLGDLGR